MCLQAPVDKRFASFSPVFVPLCSFFLLYEVIAPQLLLHIHKILVFFNALHVLSPPEDVEIAVIRCWFGSIACNILYGV